MHADVDHHSDSPQQLAIQEAEPVLGPLQVAELVHEPLRIQRPPLTVAADPYAALEACQLILPVAHLADLEMMARYALVVAGGDLSPERKDGPSLGGIPRATGPAEVLGRTGVVGRGGSARRSDHRLNLCQRFRDVEVGPVEVRDRPVHQVLEEHPQVVLPVDRPRRVAVQEIDDVGERRTGDDPGGLPRHLRLETMHLLPPPRVRLQGIDGSAEVLAAGESVPVRTDRVVFTGGRCKLLAHPAGCVCVRPCRRRRGRGQPAP